MLFISIIPSIVVLLASNMSGIVSKVNVRIVSDVVWPFCYVGLRHLQAASQQSGVGVNLEWLPFLLNPTMSEDGEDVMEHLTKKYGASAAKSFKDPNSSLATMGRVVGINWNYDRKMYNTKKVHSLLEYVKSKDNEKANQLMEHLYAGYFEQACDLSDTDKLVEMAESVGCEKDEARAAMDGDKQDEILKKDRTVKSQWGVSGVPFFLIEQKNGEDPVAFSGAYPVEFIARQLKTASSSD